MRRILGLFAHPDDEIFCSGGLMARTVRDGGQAGVVSFTRGEAGQIRRADLARRSTIGAVRAAELAAAGEVLGLDHARCFGFPDGRLTEVDRGELVRAARAAIEEYRPDTVISFDESGAYGHPDHIVMSEVALEAAPLCAGVERVLHATFPRSPSLLLELLCDWLVSLPERFRGGIEFADMLTMFADSSTMLGFAADHLRTVWFPAGSYVIEQGAPADELLLVLSGSVEVCREADDGSIRTLGVVGPGEFLGEVGVAGGTARNAHCIAVEGTTCFVLASGEASAWKPRGEAPRLAGSPTEFVSRPREVIGDLDGADLVVDVGDLVELKVKALAEHRSQYAIDHGLLPAWLLSSLLGTEHFREVWRSPSTATPVLVPADR